MNDKITGNPASSDDRPRGTEQATTGRPSAVAVRYDAQDAAPRVVAKGYGNVAETIIRTARENDLFVHESPELVNLLMQVDLDTQIPPQLYVAIAELLAWIYALEEKTLEQATGVASGGNDLGAHARPTSEEGISTGSADKT